MNYNYDASHALRKKKDRKGFYWPIKNDVLNNAKDTVGMQNRHIFFMILFERI